MVEKVIADIAFWIKHNCRKTRKGYLVKIEVLEKMEKGEYPTL